MDVGKRDIKITGVQHTIGTRCLPAPGKTRENGFGGEDSPTITTFHDQKEYFGNIRSFIA